MMNLTTFEIWNECCVCDDARKYKSEPLLLELAFSVLYQQITLCATRGIITVLLFSVLNALKLSIFTCEASSLISVFFMVLYDIET